MIKQDLVQAFPPNDYLKKNQTIKSLEISQQNKYKC